MTTNFRKPVLFIAVILSMVGCAGPLLTNSDRGKYKFEDLKDKQSILAVNVSVLPMPDAPEKVSMKEKTFFDLTDSIPHTFLKVIGQKATTTTQILDAMRAKLSVLEPPTALTPTRSIDQGNVKVRFLFSNIKKYYNDWRMLHANTRLEFLNTTLTIDSVGQDPLNRPYLFSIDRLENEFEQIDMGTLGRTQEVKFSSTLSGEAGSDAGFENSSTSGSNDTTNSADENETAVFDEKGNKVGSFKTKPGSTNTTSSSSTNKQTGSAKLGAKGELQYANTQNIKEEIQVKFKKIKTSFSFTKDELTVSQRGRPLSDISDNVFVTATLKFPNDGRFLDNKVVNKFDKLRLADNTIQPVDKIERSTIQLSYIPCFSAVDVKIKVNYEGAIRTVDNLLRGRNTMEFDDKLTYYRFEGHPAGIPITINKDGFCHNVFNIIGKFEESKGVFAEYVLLMNTDNPQEVMIYDEHGPNSFRDWMSRLIATTAIGNKVQLESKKGDLFFERTTGPKTHIYFSKAVMTAADLTELKKIRSITGHIVQ